MDETVTVLAEGITIYEIPQTGLILNFAHAHDYGWILSLIWTNTGYDLPQVIYFSPVLFFGIEESPFKSEERKFPVEFDYAVKNRQIFNYTIPDGYQIESLPENMSFNLDQNFGGYKYVISQQGNKIQLSTEFAINEPFVPSDAYGRLKKFFELVVEKENEKVVLTKI